MRKNGGKRARRLAPLDTEAGKLEVEQTRQHLTHLLGERFTRFKAVGHLTTDLLWTGILPGFEEARESAFYAWTTVLSETEFWRLIATAPSDEEREWIFASARLRAGAAKPLEIITELEKAVDPKTPHSRIFNLAREAARDAERSSDVNEPFFRELAKQENLPYEDLDPSVTVSRKTSLARKLFVSLWVGSGFWLANPADMLACLDTVKVRDPVFAHLKLRDSSKTVADWINHLKLVSYKGKGRMVFDQNAQPKPDNILIEEVGLALIKKPLPQIEFTPFQWGKIFIEKCRCKQL